MEINSYLLFFFLASAAVALFIERSRFTLLLVYFLLAGVYVEGDWVETFHDPMIQARWGALLLITTVALISVVLGRGKLERPNPFFLNFAPFLFCILISISYSTNFKITFFKSLSVLLLLASIYSLWNCQRLKLEAILNQYAKNLIFYSCLIIITNCAAAFFERAYFPRLNYFRGIFANPNTIGLLMGVFCIPVMTYAMISKKSLIQKIFALILWGVAVTMLWFSFSRAGVLSAVVGSLVFVSFSFKKRWIVLIFLVTLGFAGLIYEMRPQYFQGFREEWVLKNRKPQEGVLSSRIEPWTQSLSKAKSQLWAGYGFGMIADYSENWESRFESESMARPRGSSFVAIIEEVGLAGLSAFLIIVIYLINPFRVLTLKTKVSKEEFQLILLFYSITIAGFTNALFEDWLLSVGWISTLLFWHTAAASTGFGKLKHS